MVGRKRKYDNNESQFQMQKLVYEARQDKINGKPTGVLRISDMVRYSIYKNQLSSNEYPIVFNKDAWAAYGRIYIDRANSLPSKKVKINSKEFLVPNISELISKYKNNEDALLKYLLPLETLINSLLEEINLLKDNHLQINEQISFLKDTNQKFENLILTMAHEGTIKFYKDKYGIKNILSLKENRESLNNLNDLEGFLDKNSFKNNAPKNSSNNNYNNSSATMLKIGKLKAKNTQIDD
jgi:hypothetical protein